MFPIKKHDLLLATLFILFLAGYLTIIWPALTGPFIFDDFPNLENLKLVNGELTKSNLSAYLQSFAGSPGRPISALSFLINDYAWPSNPYSFKYTNLFIHLLNGVLLFGLLRQLSLVSKDLPQNIFWPLVAMSAWLIHPLQISAQMLAVQRMTLLSATFCFAGLWAYIVLLDKAKNLLGAFLAMAALGIFTILAFLSKENGALLPLIAWVLNATLLAELLESKNKPIKRFVIYACGIPAVLVVIGILFMGLKQNAYSIREFNLLERLMTESHILLDYLKQIFIPQLSGSGIYYDDYPVTRSLFNPISTMLISISILSSIVVALLIRKRNTLASFAILWFFTAHLMESTVLPLELYFEHRNYIPLLGPIMALTAIPFLLTNHRKLAFSFLAIWLSFLALISSLQASVWGNQALMATLWSYENPNSVRATQELSRYYYESNQKEKALQTLINANFNNSDIIDYPLNSLLLICDGVAGEKNNKIHELVDKSLVSKRYSPAVLSILGELRGKVQSNTCDEILNKEQWWALTETLLKNKAYLNNGGKYIHIERAKFRINQRDFTGTMIELEKAYYLEPDIELTQKMAEILITGGLYDEAIIWLEKGMALDEPLFDSILGSKKIKSVELIQQIEPYTRTSNRTNVDKTIK